MEGRPGPAVSGTTIRLQRRVLGGERRSSGPSCQRSTYNHYDTPSISACMVGGDTQRFESLERWSPTLFLVAGGLLVIHAGHHGLEAFAGLEYPLHHELPFGVVGMILGFVALLGLYPKLAGRSPKLARAGAVLAGLGILGWVAIGAGALAEELGTEPPAWLEAFGILIIGGVVLAYLAYGVASLLTDVVSRATGLALLAPPLVMVVNVAIATSGYGSPTGQFVVSSGFALAHLGIWGALRTEDGRTDHVEPAPETAA